MNITTEPYRSHHFFTKRPVTQQSDAPQKPASASVFRGGKQERPDRSSYSERPKTVCLPTNINK